MNWNACARIACGLTIFVACLMTSVSASDQAHSQVPVATTHDNLQPAGALADGVLTLHLEIREAKWHPDADDGPALPILAFAEEGKDPSVPGPLVRVTQGTRLHVTVKNGTLLPAFVHGLHQHPGDTKDAFVIQPGETHDITFSAGAPGTYYYWAATGYDTGIDARPTWDTELSGAFVIDPPGSHVDDRIMVIGLWYNWLVPFDFNTGFHEILTINGKSWPHTTRLSYSMGDTIRWRVINSSVAIHPMHLHGTHFEIDSKGDGERDNVYPDEQKRMVATETMHEGQTMAVKWTPSHPGNWLFHCHLALHFDGAMSRDVAEVTGVPVEEPMHHETGMAGLVVGVEVKATAAQNHPTPAPAAHKLTLTVARPSTEASRKPIQIQIQDGEKLSRTAPGSELGPTLVLHRGESTEITVLNHLDKPTAIHWHGIELDSYYDGVVGFGGDSRQVTPAIAPGESFIARMTPPRAGTFIYHTHWHDMDQLTQGLYGALIVLEPGESYDPDHDRVFVSSRAGIDLMSSPLLINGSERPTVADLRAAEHYRFRFINISPSDDSTTFSILKDGKPVTWTPVAKDGADLPAFYKKPCDAKLQFGAGETYDFEFQPQTAGDLKLDTNFLVLHAEAPIHVAQAETAEASNRK